MRAPKSAASQQRFSPGSYHINFARVRTARLVPTDAEVPVLEALALLACASEAVLQNSAAAVGITKRWFAEGYTPAVGKMRLPEALRLEDTVKNTETLATLTSLLGRKLIVLQDGQLLIPEKIRRRMVAVWNAQVGDEKDLLPAVMYPRTRNGKYKG